MNETHPPAKLNDERVSSDAEASALGAGEYFGSRAASRTAGPLTLTLCEYQPMSEVPRHAHAHAYFCYVASGGFEEHGSRRSYHASRGTLLYHSPDDVHSDLFGARGARCFNIETDALSSVSRQAGPVAGRAVRYAAEMYRELRAWDTASPAVTEGLMAALTARVAIQAQHPPRRAASHRARIDLTRVTDRLLADPCNPPALHVLAGELGVSVTQFSRAFRAQHGRGVGAFLRAVRVERAKAALTETRRAVSAVALDLGFADQAHMTRVFRDSTGWTPAAFRREAAR